MYYYLSISTNLSFTTLIFFGHYLNFYIHILLIIMLQLKQIHTIRENGTTLLFDVADLNIFRVNERVADELVKLSALEGVDETQTAPELIDIIKKMGLISNEKPEKVLESYPLKSITINIAQMCNLNCIYCYGGDGDYGEQGLMGRDVAFKAVDWLFSESGKAGEVNVTFFGGEPLMNIPLMKEVVDYSREKAKEMNKKVSFSITTNGTLLDDEIIKYFNDNKFSVVASFDGDKEIQDKNRPFKDGRGSFDSIAANMKKFLATRNGNLTARATVTSHNVNLKQIRQNLYDFGFRKAHVVVATKPVLHKKEEKENRIAFDKEEREAIFKDIEIEVGDFVEAVKKMDKQKANNTRQIGQIITSLQKKAKRQYSCGLARALYAISINGDIYPCHRFVGQEQFKMGNIFDKEIDRFKYLKQVQISTNPNCNECWARFLCGGGCYMNNFSETGDMFNPDTNHCEVFKRKAEKTILSYNSFTAPEREFISKNV